jgi:hypothetical protein
MTHPTTDRLYEAIGPGITGTDTGTLHNWIEGPGRLLGEVDDVVRDTDLPGWAPELTYERTHRPRWTGQFLGVQIPDSANDTTARNLIRDRPSFRRGTPEAISAAARTTLTGTQYVTLFEREGGAYKLRVQTFTEETPDSAATQAAILAQKPAGLTLTFQVVPMTSYLALEAQATQTYTALEAEASQTYTVLES